jgi:hypothetical protein
MTNDEPEPVVCKRWPANDTRLLDDIKNHALWLGNCGECNRKVMISERISRLMKAGHVRLIREECGEDR